MTVTFVQLGLWAWTWACDCGAVAVEDHRDLESARIDWRTHVREGHAAILAGVAA